MPVPGNNLKGGLISLRCGQSRPDSFVKSVCSWSHPDWELQALKEIHRCLVPGSGVFVMVDPFRREGETLEAYRRRASEVRVPAFRAIVLGLPKQFDLPPKPITYYRCTIHCISEVLSCAGPQCLHLQSHCSKTIYELTPLLHLQTIGYPQ